MHMFHTPIHTTFVNHDHCDFGPLIRYNIFMCWVFYKHCVHETYRKNSFRTLINVTPLRPIMGPWNVSHVRGHRSIHSLLHIFLTNTDLPLLTELNIPFNCVYNTPFIHTQLSSKFAIKDCRTFDADISKLSEFVHGFDRLPWADEACPPSKDHSVTRSVAFIFFIFLFYSIILN